MQNLVFREAKESDLQQVIDLAVEAIEHSQSPFRNSSLESIKDYRRRDLEQLRSLYAQSHVGIFVAEEKGEIKGHVIVLSGMKAVTGELQGWIIDLSVRQEFWGTGVAQELTLMAEEFIRSKGFQHLGLGVTSANKRAIRFYEKMGYLEERKQMIKKL
ncbi:MAG: GNAT family N-acetyltransferase [Candidatus Eremiobacteraeota bacterium]|nr:GNAT family N-acetyltransferase [Candidatus Eremiobacteraeota bacterium]MCL5055923.1 GNAT family N-acetyltransferase [Bacillota bacterium]